MIPATIIKAQDLCWLKISSTLNKGGMGECDQRLDGNGEYAIPLARVSEPPALLLLAVPAPPYFIPD